jgi:hypothetical protein
MRTAIKLLCDLHAVTYDTTLAMRARWRHSVYRTFETIEDADFTSFVNRESLIVVIATY